MIDLRSDTVTKPGRSMREAMFDAVVGDDVFHEDKTTNQLEEMTADIFGMEAAIFVPSGTMANQIALKLHTQPLDEVICTKDAHIYQYETAGYAFHSGIGINPLDTTDGLLNPDMIPAAIKAKQDWLPRTTLVTIENSSNRTGGNIYKLSQIENIYKLCREHNLKFHIDGARIFNAIVAGNYTTKDIGKNCDSLSLCLSKGLGAPIGSLLLSTRNNIAYARRLRKVMGGGMRQVGVLAAAGIYALENHVDRLADDHLKAQKLNDTLKTMNYVAHIRKVETNIVIFDLKPSHTADIFIAELEKKGIRMSKFGPQTVRMVTHLDISDKDIDRTIQALSSFR